MDNRTQWRADVLRKRMSESELRVGVVKPEEAQRDESSSAFGSRDEEASDSSSSLESRRQWNDRSRRSAKHKVAGDEAVSQILSLPDFEFPAF